MAATPFLGRATLFALAVVACAPPNPTTLPDAVRAAADAIDSAQLRADVTWLASDALMGRATPSPGLDTAVAFVSRRLAQLGLTPAGDSGGWCQHYTTRRLRLDSAATFIDFGGRRYVPGRDFIVWSFTDSGTWTLPFTYVQHGVRAPAKKLDPYRDVATVGRALVANGPLAMPKDESFESLGMYLTEWSAAEDLAPELHAPAVIQIAAASRVALWKSPFMVERARESTELYPAVPSAYATAPVPVVEVTPAFATVLLAGLPGGSTRAANAEVNRDYPPSYAFPETRKATIHIGVASAEVFRPCNVVAIVPGSGGPADGAVVLGAHLDGAIGVRRTPADSIFNAADDNASGSVALLAVAGAMMRAPRPRRTVVFLWDSGEEEALWGSRYFTTHPPVPLDRVVAYYNVDMIGRSKAPGTNVPMEEDLAGPDEIQLAGPRVLSSSLDSLLERTNAEYLAIGLDHRFDVATQEFFYPRTDAAPLLERGVITVNWMNGTHEDYHRVGDEASKLDIRRMTRVTQTIFATAWMLAAVKDAPALTRPIPDFALRYGRQQVR